MLLRRTGSLGVMLLVLRKPRPPFPRDAKHNDCALTDCCVPSRFENGPRARLLCRMELDERDQQGFRLHLEGGAGFLFQR